MSLVVTVETVEIVEIVETVVNVVTILAVKMVSSKLGVDVSELHIPIGLFLCDSLLFVSRSSRFFIVASTQVEKRGSIRRLESTLQ